MFIVAAFRLAIRLVDCCPLQGADGDAEIALHPGRKVPLRSSLVPIADSPKVLVGVGLHSLDGDVSCRLAPHRSESNACIEAFTNL